MCGTSPAALTPTKCWEALSWLRTVVVETSLWTCGGSSVTDDAPFGAQHRATQQG